MGIFNLNTIKSKHPLYSYFLAIFLSALFIGLKWVLRQYAQIDTPFFILFTPILISAFYGGLRLGVTATFITLIAGIYFFLMPFIPFDVDAIKIATVVIFTVNGILLSLFISLYEKANRLLQESEVLKAAVIRLAPDGILSISNDGTVLDVNPSFERMVGLGKSRIRGRKISEVLMPANGDGKIINRDNLSIPQGKCIEMKAAHHSNPEFPVDVTIKHISSNNLSLYVGYVKDITDRKKAEAERLHIIEMEHTARVEAEEAVRARDEFLSIASHELKTPLTSMLLQLQGVLHSIRTVSLANFSVERTMKMLESAEQQSRRLTRMINDLLNVSLITTGRLDLEKENFDLSFVLKEVVTRFSEQAERLRSPIIVEASTPIIGTWDKLRIEQVITNLISNALKYGKGKKVYVTLVKKEEKAILSVKDEGIGIPEEDFKRIFGRFERAVGKSDIKGLGVGLYISYQIIQTHNGTIKVISKEGEGSTFIVELPLYSDTNNLV